VDIEVGVAHPEKVDKAAVAAVLPYGQAQVNAVKGGLDITNDDGSNTTVVANVVAVVYLDIQESAS